MYGDQQRNHAPQDVVPQSSHLTKSQEHLALQQSQPKTNEPASPLQKAHLLTFSQIPQMSNGTQQSQTNNAQDEHIQMVIGQKSEQKAQLSSKKRKQLNKANISVTIPSETPGPNRAQVSHQTPFFSKLDTQNSNNHDQKLASPRSNSALSPPSDTINGDELRSGNKLMQELIAISQTVNGLSQQKNGVQLATNQKRNSNHQTLEEPNIQFKYHSTASLRQTQKPNDASSILSPRVKKQHAQLQQSLSTRKVQQIAKSQTTTALQDTHVQQPSSKQIPDENKMFSETVTSMRQTQSSFNKSKSLKVMPKKKDLNSAQGPRRVHFATNLNANLGSTQAKNAYLTTMRPVNFTQSQSSRALLDNPSKVLSEQQKQKQNSRGKLTQVYSSVKEQNHNPARIYGRKATIGNSQSQPQMQTAAPKIPQSHQARFFTQQSASSELLATNKSQSNNQSHQNQQVIASQDKKVQPNNGTGSASKNDNGKQRSEATKLKKLNSFASGQDNTSQQLPRSAILAQSTSGQQKSTTAPSAATLGQSVSTQSFKRNRFLVDKNGRRINPSPTTQEITTSNNNNNIVVPAQSLPQTGSVPREKPSKNGETINVQVKIQQPTSQISQLKQLNILKKQGQSQRTVQSSQQQKRQFKQIKASFKSHANSSQGFHSEEMIQMKQSQNKNGAITTHLSFKINGNANAQETGLQLQLTQGLNHQNPHQNSHQHLPQQQLQQVQQLQNDPNLISMHQDQQNQMLQHQQQHIGYIGNPAPENYHNFQRPPTQQMHPNVLPQPIYNMMPRNDSYTNQLSFDGENPHLLSPMTLQHHKPETYLEDEQMTLQRQQLLLSNNNKQSSVGGIGPSDLDELLLSKQSTAQKSDQILFNHSQMQSLQRKGVSTASRAQRGGIVYSQNNMFLNMPSRSEYAPNVVQMQQENYSQQCFSERPSYTTSNQQAHMDDPRSAMLYQQQQQQQYQKQQNQVFQYQQQYRDNIDYVKNFQRKPDGRTNSQEAIPQRHQSHQTIYDNRHPVFNNINNPVAMQGINNNTAAVHIPQDRLNLHRIMTAQSQQVKMRSNAQSLNVPQGQSSSQYLAAASSNNMPKRKYRPVLPKGMSNPISLSVKDQKSPGVQTEKRQYHNKAPAINHQDQAFASSASDNVQRTLSQPVMSSMIIMQEHNNQVMSLKHNEQLYSFSKAKETSANDLQEETKVHQQYNKQGTNQEFSTIGNGIQVQRMDQSLQSPFPGSKIQVPPLKNSFDNKRESVNPTVLSAGAAGSAQGSCATDQNDVTASFLASGYKSAKKATEDKFSTRKLSVPRKSGGIASPEEFLTVSKIGKADSLQVSPFCDNLSSQNPDYNHNQRMSTPSMKPQNSSRQSLAFKIKMQHQPLKESNRGTNNTQTLLTSGTKQQANGHIKNLIPAPTSYESRRQSQHGDTLVTSIIPPRKNTDDGSPSGKYENSKLLSEFQVQNLRTNLQKSPVNDKFQHLNEAKRKHFQFDGTAASEGHTTPTANRQAMGENEQMRAGSHKRSIKLDDHDQQNLLMSNNSKPQHQALSMRNLREELRKIDMYQKQSQQPLDLKSQESVGERSNVSRGAANNTKAQVRVSSQSRLFRGQHLQHLSQNQNLINNPIQVTDSSCSPQKSSQITGTRNVVAVNSASRRQFTRLSKGKYATSSEVLDTHESNSNLTAVQSCDNTQSEINRQRQAELLSLSKGYLGKDEHMNEQMEVRSTGGIYERGAHSHRDIGYNNLLQVHQTPNTNNPQQSQQNNQNHRSRYAAAETQSQASSARQHGYKAKVIYNKFFKDKGFLPPLMNTNISASGANAAQGVGGTIVSNTLKGSRSISVNSRMSEEDQNYDHTIESIRLRCRSPDSQQLPQSMMASDRGGVVLYQATVPGAAQALSHQKVTAQQNYALERIISCPTEVSDDKETLSVEKNFLPGRLFHSTADKNELRFTTETDSVAMPSQMSTEKERSSTEQKKGFKLGGGVVTNDNDNGGTNNQELSSCFTNALNMALSQAPIALKTSQLNQQQPQFEMVGSPADVMSNKNNNHLRHQQNQTSSLQYGSLSKKSTQSMANSASGKISMVKGKGKKKGSGIIYTGKEKPDEVMKQLEKKQNILRKNFDGRKISQPCSQSKPAPAAAQQQPRLDIGRGYTQFAASSEEILSPKGQNKNIIRKKHQVLQNKIRAGECVTDFVTQKSDENIDESEMKELQGHYAMQFARVNTIQTGSEERTAEGLLQNSLKKTVKQDSKKYRLKSSKNPPQKALVHQNDRHQNDTYNDDDEGIVNNYSCSPHSEQLIRVTNQQAPAASQNHADDQQEQYQKESEKDKIRPSISRQSDYITRLIGQHNQNNQDQISKLSNEKMKMQASQSQKSIHFESKQQIDDLIESATESPDQILTKTMNIKMQTQMINPENKNLETSLQFNSQLCKMEPAGETNMTFGAINQHHQAAATLQSKEFQKQQYRINNQDNRKNVLMQITQQKSVEQLLPNEDWPHSSNQVSENDHSQKLQS